MLAEILKTPKNNISSVLSEILAIVYGMVLFHFLFNDEAMKKLFIFTCSYSVYATYSILLPPQ